MIEACQWFQENGTLKNNNLLQSINEKLSRIQRISERYQESSNISVNGISFKDDIMESIKQANIATNKNQTQINDSQEEEKNVQEEQEGQEKKEPSNSNIPDVPEMNNDNLVPIKRTKSWWCISNPNSKLLKILLKIKHLPCNKILNTNYIDYFAFTIVISLIEAVVASILFYPYLINKVQLEASVPIVVYFLSISIMTLILAVGCIYLDSEEPNAKIKSGPFKANVEQNCKHNLLFE